MSTATTVATDYAYIVRTPGTLGGKPRIAGTRIRVSDIAARIREGLSPQQVVSSDCYPSLTLSQAYSALAYYEDHREEIEEEFRSALESADRHRREHPDIVRDRRPGEPAG